MKSVNGIVLMIVGVMLLWIGVTGRFPALIAAIGLVRGSNPNQSKAGATSGVPSINKSGSTPSSSDQPFLDKSVTDWLKTTQDNLSKTQGQLWAEATGKSYGASASY